MLTLLTDVRAQDCTGSVTLGYGNISADGAAHNALRPRHTAFPSLISQGLGA